jgi:hypothetical protein
MPDTLNKQSLINLLIDSPLREPIKINLIDIVNNTSEPDLPKVYSTITKELEIFQKATERRMKLAEETNPKLGGTATPSTPAPESTMSATPSPVAPSPVAPVAPLSVPPLDLPPLPTPPISNTGSQENGNTGTQSNPPLSVPPLDLPPMPASTSSSLGGPTSSSVVEPVAAPVETPVTPAPVVEPAAPVMQPFGAPAMASSSDEDALAEIQKELDSLKSATATEISSAAAPVAPTK